jgi:hypothetical protein
MKNRFVGKVCKSMKYGQKTSSFPMADLAHGGAIFLLAIESKQR